MKKEKQIEEMAREMCWDCARESPCSLAEDGGMCNSVRKQATALYNAGYRKQSEGEWNQQMRPYDDFIVCSSCGEWFNLIDNCTEKFKFCPNCGARMGGGAE